MFDNEVPTTMRHKLSSSTRIVNMRMATLTTVPSATSSTSPVHSPVLSCRPACMGPHIVATVVATPATIMSPVH